MTELPVPCRVCQELPHIFYGTLSDTWRALHKCKASVEVQVGGVKLFTKEDVVTAWNHHNK